VAQLAERLEQLAELAKFLMSAAPQAEPVVAAPPGREGFGPLDLLVVQGTPFCNLDCRYCYLPDRNRTEQMAADVLDALFRWVFASGLVRTPFTVAWHAGEPMVLRPEFYAGAFEAAARHNAEPIPLLHSFQTNATLIDQVWCDFIKTHHVQIGVSVDGPAFLHDRHRVTRRAAGTHHRVMRGIERLRANGIAFHVISVLTREALDYPDEMYEFYVDHGIEQVGFNIEEIEGPHRESSLSDDDAQTRFRRFMERFLGLAADGPARLWVREQESMTRAILAAEPDAAVWTQETTPFAIVSVDWRGNVSTFSPELLGLVHDRYGDFTMGNVCTDSIETILASPRFAALRDDIAAGVERCRQTCAYFRFCGGGAPVNKLSENGSFASTETLFCRLNRQAMLDVVLDQIPPSASRRRWLPV
jgi:uncharacterized protein